MKCVLKFNSSNNFTSRKGKMKISFELIKKITSGAAYVTEEANGVTFHRFNKAEEEMYKELDVIRKRTDSLRVMTPAGVKLSFITNSKTIKMTADLSFSSRRFFAFDIFENGNLLTSITSFKESELPFEYSILNYELGRFEESATLSDGEKEVTIHLPWSAKMENFNLFIDDGASIIPAEKPTKKIMLYGDSITQGFDALYPHRRYAAKLAELLGAEEFNKAIGGEVFNPLLATHKADFTPDYITVAYGINDWLDDREASFKTDAREFYLRLSNNYPDSKIFAITPIWTSECNAERKVGSFSFVAEHIADITKDLPNVTVIKGGDLVPHYTDLFADLFLHPRDAGFDFYAMNLYNEIKKHI